MSAAAKLAGDAPLRAPAAAGQLYRAFSQSRRAWRYVVVQQVRQGPPPYAILVAASRSGNPLRGVEGGMDRAAPFTSMLDVDDRERPVMRRAYELVDPEA